MTHPQRDIVIGITYPKWMEVREPDEIDRDIAKVAAISDRLRIVRLEYEDSEQLRTLRGTPPYDGVREIEPPVSAAMRQLLSEVEILLSEDLPLDLLQLAPRLRWVQCMGAGVGQLISCGIPNQAVRLTSGSGNNSVSISEFVLSRLLMVWKRHDDLAQKQTNRDWTGTYGREVSGKTLGLVGFGAINECVAARAKAFDMRVMATRRSAGAGTKLENVDQVYPVSRLKEMLAECDAVCSALPETPATLDLFDEDMFGAMKPGSIFVNVGRGTAVVEPDLERALRSGHLAAAAIDVARVEPLDPSSSLWDTPNLYISPHSASSPDYFFTLLYDTFRENLARYLAGESPLLNEVETKAGY